jgi:hypothetical protein
VRSLARRRVGDQHEEVGFGQRLRSLELADRARCNFLIRIAERANGCVVPVELRLDECLQRELPDRRIGVLERAAHVDLDRRSELAMLDEVHRLRSDRSVVIAYT